jgi:hypothetical protein
MLKRKRTWILLVLLLTVGIGVYFEPTYCVRGWLHGEAFFEGRPTSYWRTVVERDLHIDSLAFEVSRQLPSSRSWWQRCKDWIGYEPRVDSSHQLLEDAAAAILRELAADTTPQIAAFAQDVLDKDAPTNPIAHHAMMVARGRHWHDRYWMDLIRAYNMKCPPEP